jgi:hypothetical protein
VGPTDQDDSGATGPPEQETEGKDAPPSTASEGEQPEAAAEDPEAVYERVLAEERSKGSSDPVATARAKAARMRAVKGTSGPADG